MSNLTPDTPSAPVTICEDCPPVGYPTDETRCLPCPRRDSSGKPILPSASQPGTDGVTVSGKVFNVAWRAFLKCTGNKSDALEAALDAALPLALAEREKWESDRIADGIQEAKDDADGFDKELWRAMRSWLDKQPGFAWSEYDNEIGVDGIIEWLNNTAQGQEEQISRLQSHLSTIDAAMERVVAKARDVCSIDEHAELYTKFSLREAVAQLRNALSTHLQGVAVREGGGDGVPNSAQGQNRSDRDPAPAGSPADFQPMGDVMRCYKCGKPSTLSVNVAPHAASDGTMKPVCQEHVPPFSAFGIGESPPPAQVSVPFTAEAFGIKAMTSPATVTITTDGYIMAARIEQGREQIGRR